MVGTYTQAIKFILHNWYVMKTEIKLLSTEHLNAQEEFTPNNYITCSELVYTVGQSNKKYRLDSSLLKV